MKNTRSKILIVVALLAGLSISAQAQTLTSVNIGGYLSASYNGAPTSYNAGYTMYTTMLGRNQYAYYSSAFSASFQFGTWMHAQNSTANCYSDIEGSVGCGGWYGNVWNVNGFGMGVVGPDFAGVSNGTSGGWGKHGMYAVAQISPCLLSPPRSEMFRGASYGQIAGYGYLALPLLPAKATTAGFPVPTGDHWWTLFLNTRNFKGPVSTVVPYFWSQFTTNRPDWAGQLLDSRWVNPNKQIANESHNVPGVEYDGPEGNYARVEPMFVAINHSTNSSIVLNSPTVYDQNALWNAAQQWFTNNGAAPVGPFNSVGAVAQTITGGDLGWRLNNSPVGAAELAMNTYLTSNIPDSSTLAYRWGTNQVTFTQFANGTPAAKMPEYYKNLAGIWTPVAPESLPTNVAAKLASVSFEDSPPTFGIQGVYTMPNDSCWTNPGPVAGPFQVRLDDGNIVTYYWYRFADQPAIMMAGLTPAEREQIQTVAVKIHTAWTNGASYIAPPTKGTLADVEPALLVVAPTNIPSVGYVPIATREEWGGLVTNTWKNANSGNLSVGANWVSTNAPADGGHSYYSLNFTPAGKYVVTNDMTNGYGYAGYAVNQLNFSGAVTLAGNPITLTCDVGSLPQITQNSTNTVVITTPLNLDVSTVLGGTGVGLVVISNTISGPWQRVMLNSTGTWQVCGLSANTYSGGTLIKKGTLIWGAMTNGTSPDCSYALGTGPVTLYSNATLRFEHAHPINSLILNGGTLHAANSAGVTWMGPVTLNSNTTVRTDYGMEITSTISGNGRLTKTGTNTLTLSGSNTYAGPNLVQAGGLTCSTAASLIPGSLSISNGAVVNLNYSGTREIFALTLGGSNMLAGVYGSTNSVATYKSAYFGGTGTVTVPVPLSIVNLPDYKFVATNIATLKASLGMSLGYIGTNATVRLYWGTTNGGTNAGAWQKSATVGAWTNVVATNISGNATGLLTNTTYYFTFLATNAAYNVWATNVLSFITASPVITVQPTNDAKLAGLTTTFTVNASGATSYQWFKDGVPLSDGVIVSGSGTATLILSGITMADAGNYSVLISNVFGSVTSIPATLTVLPPATFTWDANGTGANRTDGGGTWLSTSKNWWNGSTNLNWGDYNNALIGSGGAGGIINLGSGVTVNQLTFTNFSGTYTLEGGSLTVRSNLTVASSSGTVVLDYLIEGPGGLTMNSTGSLYVHGVSSNSFSGGTIIKRGTLLWGMVVNGGSPYCNYALGTGPVTLNSGAALHLERADPRNALILNGGTLKSINGWGFTWMGPVTVNSNTTVQAQYRAEIAGNISGVGGLTKTDANTLTFSGTNTYSGATVLSAGTVSWSRTNAMAPGHLSIGSSAVANLNYSGTRTINWLTIGGVVKPAGTYGSTNSTAANKDSHFTGTGIVTLVPSQGSISNLPASSLGATTATLNATLTGNGVPYTVAAFYNTVNGGTNAVAWTNSQAVGSWTLQGTTNISCTVTGLMAGTKYYFTFRGTNAIQSLWASNVLSFTTVSNVYYTFVYQAGSNGSISGTATQVVASGNNGTPVTAAPSPGYKFVNWSDGSTANPRTDISVSNNITVTASFVPDPVIVVSQGAIPVGNTSASLSGLLTGGTAGSAWICWGATDGGTISTGNWANVVSMGAVTQGVVFSNLVTGLSTNTTYFYRCYAQKVGSSDWSDTATTFSGTPAGGCGAWTPSDITTVAWYDAADTNTVLSSGSAVTNWLDKSGNNLHLKQTSAALQPATGATINSLNAINFTDDIMTTASNPFGATVSNAFVIAVHKVDTVANGTFFSLTGNPASNNNRWQSHAPYSGGTLYFDCGGAAAPNRISTAYGVTAGSSALVSFYCSTAANVQQVYKNGTLLVSDSSGHAVTSSGNIFVGGVGTSYQDTTLGEFIIINGTVDATTRQKLEGYLAWKWGLQGNLPAGHPYKASAPSDGTIANQAPIGIANDGALLNAALNASGTNYTVTVYYGTTDGGANVGAWAASATVGSWTNVSTNVSYVASGLTSGTTYHYTFMASNAGRQVWASPSWTFRTTGTPPPVTVNHAVPHAWLSAMNPSWNTNYEAAALSDSDGDGYSTWQEYWSGTDPQDSNSYLRIDSIGFSGTNLIFSWRHAQVDAVIPPITIQARSNLVTGSWVGIGSHMPTNGVNSWSAGSSVQGFYRLAVTNAP
jgi:autotransporter-associated beta strand protein